MEKYSSGRVCKRRHRIWRCRQTTGGMDMLQIKNLNIVHKKDFRTILENFSFTLNKGERAAVIGEEGNGKSTLLRWIAQPEWIEPYASATGERICSGERIGYLPQELPVTEKGKSVYEFFCGEPLFFEQEPGTLGKIAKRLRVCTDFFYREQKMGTLSGGEKIKAQLARILLAEPTVLLLDEPTNDLDTETLEWLEELLLHASQSVLYISHDETLLERTANVIIHMEQVHRKTVSRYTIARTDYQMYLSQRTSQFEAQEREARNERREEQIRQEKFRKIQQRVEHEQRAISRQDPHGGRLLKKKMKAVKAMERRYEREAGQMTQMPEEERAVFLKMREGTGIPAGKTVLDFYLERLQAEENGETLAERISLQVRGAEKICIVGPNGAGKTTLLKRIAAELLERKDIVAAYMPQNYEDLLEMEKTPVDYLAPSGSKEAQTRARTYLGAMRYTADEMEHPMKELSGGQKAKVLLLKMSMSGANVLLLDEPTRNFSPLSGPVIREVLRAYQGAIISISHDRKYIEEVCSSRYLLTKQGLVLLKEE